MEQFNDEVWSFIRDDRFVRWVLQPTVADDLHWQTWMAAHPEHAGTIEKARHLVLELHTSQQPSFSTEALESFYRNLDRKVKGERTPAAEKTYMRKRYTLKPLLGIAAGLVLLIGMSTLWWQLHQRPAATGLQSHLAASNLTRMNKGAESQTAYLVDGSSVVLQAGASIEHAAFLQKDKREVHLTGNAFFEVAKDSTRPFYVYTPHLAIRVLGTSFHVHTAANGNMEVIVRTGKVSVFRLGDLQKPLYILKPNQRVRYDLSHDRFAEDSVSSATAAVIPAASQAFNFEDAPVLHIFHTMEQAYGIPIVADEKIFARCTLTTSLQGETFEEKLRIICAAINATYKMNAGQVLIEGQPCNP